MQNHLYLYPNLVKIRKSKCSQAALAEHLGISQQEISRYERGETKAPINYLIDVADFCGVSVDDILGRTRDIPQMLSEEESEMLRLFRCLSPENRIRIAERADTLLTLQKTANQT